MMIKEIVKKNYKLVIGLIAGIVISGTSVFATTVLSSNKVGYSNISSGLSSTTVQDVIDEVYKKVKHIVQMDIIVHKIIHVTMIVVRNVLEQHLFIQKYVDKQLTFVQQMDMQVEIQ